MEEELLCACSRYVALFVPHQYHPLRSARKMLNIVRPQPRSSFRRRLCSLPVPLLCLPTKRRAYFVNEPIRRTGFIKYLCYVRWICWYSSAQRRRLLPCLTYPQRKSLSGHEKHFHESASPYCLFTAGLFSLNGNDRYLRQSASIYSLG